MSVYIIDYGMGNLLSVKRAFELCGADVVIASKPSDLDEAYHMVLPGVGSFRDGMKNLREGGWIPKIKENINKGTPLLGICLGMQLLADKGYEVEETEGLGLIPGEIKKISYKDSSLRIPHVGWNNIIHKKKSEITVDVDDDTDFYFVHSYHFIPKNCDDVISVTEYGELVVSIIGSGVVFGTQFHPEKSGKAGFQIIKNFLQI
ncbi:MAG: imidazole glycerol phosphate synthase subunit HisH [Clostridiales bacterium]|nr:imidazole glycerol phosphate synthase subunit HisH [Clostridiales bacterium]